MTKFRLIIIGVVSYVLFTLFLTPASWLLKLAPLPAELQLGAVSGNVWQGEVAGVRYQQLQFEPLRWQLNGWSLFSGTLQLALQSGSAQSTAAPYFKGTVSYGIGGSAVNDAVLRLPVAQVLPMLSLPLPVDASGELVLDVQSFSQGQPWCKGLTGSASWQDARLQTPNATWLDLQSLFGMLRCDNGTVVLTTDGQNLLGLDIKAVINAEQLLVNGTLKPDDSMPEEVHQAMQFLGMPDEQGRYPIRF